MPQVTIRSGFVGADGIEEELTEYLCDVIDCPNAATHVLGCVKELGTSAVVCGAHAPTIKPTDRGSA